MTGLGLILTILFSLGSTLLPRRYAALALFCGVLFITQGQAIDLAGVNFMAIRFVELAAAIRVVLRKETRAILLSTPDKTLLLFFAVYIAMHTLQTGSFSMYTFGLAVDGIIVFFVFRALINTLGELEHFLRGVVLLLIPFALLMITEAVKGYNMFSLMGGVQDTPVYRNGYFRCQASFRHAISAGTVGATFLSIFIGLLFQRKERVWAACGIVACLAIVITSHSSGPLMTTIVTVGAWICWKFREHIKWVRRAIFGSVIGLHLLMKAPVWFIFDRISGYIGGDGWHRANLIDKFVNSFWEWWLVGMPMEKTVNWAATVTKFGYVDVTNYYVSIGIGGGLPSLIVFIFLIIAIFRVIGSGLQAIREEACDMKASEALLWGLGISVFAHAVNLTAVIYFDQSYVIWYMHLALAVTMADYFQNKIFSDNNDEEKRNDNVPTNLVMFRIMVF